jgi:hypothetical protein
VASEHPKGLNRMKKSKRLKDPKDPKDPKHQTCLNWRPLMHPAQPTMPTPPALEQRARARLITPDYDEVPVRTTLRYTPDDPFAVHIDFPAGVSADDVNVTWAFARALLAEGLDRPTGIGDVHLWPHGSAHTVVELRSPHGMAMIRFDTSTLRRFLRRSYVVVALGGETLGPAFEGGLASLLDGV